MKCLKTKWGDLLETIIGEMLGVIEILAGQRCFAKVLDRDIKTETIVLWRWGGRPEVGGGSWRWSLSELVARVEFMWPPVAVVMIM